MNTKMHWQKFTSLLCCFSKNHCLKQYSAVVKKISTRHIVCLFLNHQQIYSIYPQNFTQMRYIIQISPVFRPLRISPRPISTRQLNALPHLHSVPINLVVFKGSYFFRMGYLILRGASRLDAFSVYPVRTWLLCPAFGNATDTPAVRPSRSSRTKDSSSQISYAHAG